MHFPYLADENADDDDCEVKARCAARSYLWQFRHSRSGSETLIHLTERELWSSAQVTTEGATATDSKMKEALLKLGTPFFRKQARVAQRPWLVWGAGVHRHHVARPRAHHSLRPQVKAWVKEMAAGGPGGEGPAGGAAGAEAGAADGGAAKKKAASNGAEKEREAAAAKAAAKAKEEEGPTRTIEATERCVFHIMPSLF